MDYASIFVGLMSGVLLALAGTWINILLNQRAENSKKTKNAEYEIFLKLGELYNWYFWFATNELHGKETPDDITSQSHKVATDIAKLLHENENTEYAEDLIRILYDESYETYDARWKHMSSLLEKMGSKVVPVHKEYLRNIDESNLRLMAKSRFVAKAPASTRFKLGV